MNVLRMIKLFGWETKMNEKIAEKREDELRYIWKQRILEVCTVNLKFVLLGSTPPRCSLCAPSLIIPVMAMIATYATYVRYRLTLPVKRPNRRFLDVGHEARLDSFESLCLNLGF